MNDYQIALHSMCETFCIYSHNCLTCDKLDCLKKNGVTQLKYLVENSDLIEKVNKYRWHDLRKNPNDLPPAETEVDVVCVKRNGMQIRTHGFYEDGTIHEEDSYWWWYEISDYGTYCEETDDYIIPKGWWEYRHYNPEETLNGAIDDEILAWKYIEPFEEEENE